MHKNKRIGYARVSTDDQNLDLQINALKEARCNQIFTDHGISAIAKKRDGFDAAIEALKSGDIFTIWKMDRAFRSLRHALDIFDYFENEKIEFHVLTEGIDTTTPMGKCFFQIRNSFAELERNLISERTKAGLAAARLRGKRLGRPPSLSSQQIVEIKARCLAGESMAMIADRCRLSTRTLYRAISKV